MTARRRAITIRRKAVTIAARAHELRQIETTRALAKQFGKRVIVKKDASK